MKLSEGLRKGLAIKEKNRAALLRRRDRRRRHILAHGRHE